MEEGKRESRAIYTAVRKGRGRGGAKPESDESSQRWTGKAELIAYGSVSGKSPAVVQDETQWKPWEERPKFGAHRADLSYGLRS